LRTYKVDIFLLLFLSLSLKEIVFNYAYYIYFMATFGKIGKNIYLSVFEKV